MGALELILLATLPLVLLVGLFESPDDSPEAEGDAAPKPGDDLATGENLLDFMDWPGRDGGAPPPGSGAIDGDGPDPDMPADGTVEAPPTLAGPDSNAFDPPAAAGPVADGDNGPSPPAPAPDAGPDPDTGGPVPPEFGRFAARDPILGSSGSDTLTAGDDGAVIFANGLDGGAQAGNLLRGGSGDDTLLGGRGPDRLVAGAGDTLLHASYGPELEIAQGSDLFAWRDNALPDTLEGGPGDDRIVFARGDVASGGGGSNGFEVWHDPGSAQPVAVITDFDPAADRLDVVVRIDEEAHPGCDSWAWDRSLRAAVFETARLEVRATPDGSATDVLVEGEPVARLLGAPALDPTDIRVFAFWDIVS